MGLLDDAIREHLDLKRQRGADPTEIERAEREALGPVRREPLGSEELAAGSLPLGGPLGDEVEIEPDGWSESFGDEPALLDVDRTPQFSEPSGLTPPPARAPEPPPLTIRDEPGGAYFEEDEENFEDDQFDDDFAEAAAAGEGDRFDVEPASPTGVEPHPASPMGGAKAPPVAPPPAADAPLAPPLPPPPSPLDDETLGETVEYDVEHSFKPGDENEEDVLEETPEFLQDTPDHDRLWFEQRPPRDFDFDN